LVRENPEGLLKSRTVLPSCINFDNG
jgi:hypothetical protein